MIHLKKRALNSSTNTFSSVHNYFNEFSFDKKLSQKKKLNLRNIDRFNDVKRLFEIQLGSLTRV